MGARRRARNQNRAEKKAEMKKAAGEMIEALLDWKEENEDIGRATATRTVAAVSVMVVGLLLIG